MSTPRVNIKAQPIPKSIVRVAITGDFMKAFGADDYYIRNVQQGVAEGLVSKIVVYAVDAYGWARDDIALRFDPLGNDDKITIDTSDGRSTIEALDVGIAGIVHYCVVAFARKGFRSDIRFFWSPKAESNPQLKHDATSRLNFSGDLPPIQYPTNATVGPAANQPVSYQPGYAARQVLSIAAGKDKGVHIDVSTSRRVR